MKKQNSLFVMLGLLNLSLLSLLGACAPRYLSPPAPPLDVATISQWSRLDCPAGTFYRPVSDDYVIYTREPAGPLLFVVSQGDDACVTNSPYNEWGWSEWLNVEFSSPCLANNSIWRRTHYSISDSVHIFARFERIDRNERESIDLQANYGRRFSSLKRALGFITYSCQ